MLFELQRLPTEKEIIDRVGVSPERYHEVMRVSKPIYSLNARNRVTQEELINGIEDGVEGDKRSQPALLRLALDDVVNKSVFFYDACGIKIDLIITDLQRSSTFELSSCTLLQVQMTISKIVFELNKLVWSLNWKLHKINGVLH